MVYYYNRDVDLGVFPGVDAISISLLLGVDFLKLNIELCIKQQMLIKHFEDCGKENMYLDKSVKRMSGGIIRSEKMRKSQENQILHNFHLIFFSMMDIKIFTHGGARGGRQHSLFRKMGKSQEQYPY